jgi:phage terminase small subunit
MAKVAKESAYSTMPTLGKKVISRLNTTVPALKFAQKKLNAKAWAFVQELVSNDGKISLKEAAIRAGYIPTSAAQMAYKLTDPAQSPHVVAAIQAYRSELNAQYGTNYERHMKDLQTIRDKALEAGAFGAAVQAEYRRGQALGTIYVDRKEIRHGSIDTMSKEEVERKLEEIKKIYGQTISQDIIEVDMRTVKKSVAKEKEPTFTELEEYEARESSKQEDS